MESEDNTRVWEGHEASVNQAETVEAQWEDAKRRERMLRRTIATRADTNTRLPRETAFCCARAGMGGSTGEVGRHRTNSGARPDDRYVVAAGVAVWSAAAQGRLRVTETTMAAGGAGDEIGSAVYGVWRAVILDGGKRRHIGRNDGYYVPPEEQRETSTSSRTDPQPPPDAATVRWPAGSRADWAMAQSAPPNDSSTLPVFRYHGDKSRKRRGVNLEAHPLSERSHRAPSHATTLSRAEAPGRPGTVKRLILAWEGEKVRQEDGMQRIEEGHAWRDDVAEAPSAFTHTVLGRLTHTEFAAVPPSPSSDSRK
ncbi:hypothetical protein B0H14DRAFT_2590690 [Mycena olivaceomarginata]|nr:hypothetical protein B0H14DRAFT_2590690 [Mycena olivaceomarginata]